MLDILAVVIVTVQECSMKDLILEHTDKGSSLILIISNILIFQTFLIHEDDVDYQ